MNKHIVNGIITVENEPRIPEESILFPIRAEITKNKNMGNQHHLFVTCISTFIHESEQ